MTFVPAGDYDSSHVFSALGAWNGPSDIKKCCIHIFPTQIFWWILAGCSHIYQTRWCGWGRPLLAHSRLNHFSLKFPFCSPLAGMYEVMEGRMRTEWHGPLGFSCYTSPSSCLSVRFRNVESVLMKESPSLVPSRKKHRFFFGLPARF